MKDYSKDMEIRTSHWSPQNMRIMNTEDPQEKGVCYGSSMQTWISLLKHIELHDICLTGVEEAIHQAIRDEVTGAMDESLNFDVEHEEWIVERMFWALAGWILNE